MAKNYTENKTPTPSSGIQHNISFEDAMTCDVLPELLRINGHTIITHCGSKEINFSLPVLLCHADPKFTPGSYTSTSMCEFFKNNKLNQKGMNVSDGTKSIVHSPLILSA